MNILGIDIGGTSIKSDVYNEDGNALGHFSEDVYKRQPCHTKSHKAQFHLPSHQAGTSNPEVIDPICLIN